MDPIDPSEETAVDRLSQVEHIVVVMMENRSFDHMLGYLSLPEPEGSGRGDVDGLRGDERNEFAGNPYGIRPMRDSSGGMTKVQDPGHTGADVGEQMAHGMSGFVTNYLTTRAYQDGHDVMTYQQAGDVPVYDFFAREFAICDRWFCSVPGSTWPNRVTSLAGQTDSTDNRFPPLYSEKSFVHWLKDDVTWRWYSSDPGSLRLVDADYRVGNEDHFAYAEKPSFVQRRTFFTDAMKEELPNVAWVDPNFVDLGGLQGANDDHPPTDVMAGQSFVLKIYQALKQSALWDRSMLVIVYDEHGGFYDHVDPTAPTLPQEFRDRAQFRHFGPRVPALVVSPFIAPGGVFGSPQGEDPRFLFDHTALIKTILTRFGKGFDGLPDRVKSSSHLGHLLTDGPARPGPDLEEEDMSPIREWWGKNVMRKIVYPGATVPALQELGLVEGPSGAQGLGQGVLAAIGKVVDWVRGKGARPKLQELRETAARPTTTVPDETPGTLAHASELQLGVATAARHLRRDLKLRSGQP